MAYRKAEDCTQEEGDFFCEMALKVMMKAYWDHKNGVNRSSFGQFRPNRRKEGSDG